jgi:hypothetical protein
MRRFLSAITLTTALGCTGPPRHESVLDRLFPTPLHTGDVGVLKHPGFPEAATVPVTTDGGKVVAVPVGSAVFVMSDADAPELEVSVLDGPALTGRVDSAWVRSK